MTTINWDSVKFRASSWGNLLAESKDKKEPIGKTCAGELVKIYNMEMYGRKKDIVQKQMTKGILCEPESIKLFSLVEGKIFFKNDERLENGYFTGHPDIYCGDDIFNAEEVHDIKSSYELDTFTPKLIEPLDNAYKAQLNVYFDLCGCSSGSIAYCLVDAPESVLMDEKRRLLYSMNVISEESPEYVSAARELERNLTYPDIDYRERVIKIEVKRDDELIEKMKKKVPVLREWLHNFHLKHMAQYPKNH